MLLSSKLLLSSSKQPSIRSTLPYARQFLRWHRQKHGLVPTDADWRQFNAADGNDDGAVSRMEFEVRETPSLGWLDLTCAALTAENPRRACGSQVDRYVKSQAAATAEGFGWAAAIGSSAKRCASLAEMRAGLGWEQPALWIDLRDRPHAGFAEWNGAAAAAALAREALQGHVEIVSVELSG